MRAWPLAAAMFCVGMLSGCGSGESSSAHSEIPPPPVLPPQPEHYYSVNDGFDYGYEPAISPDDQQAGIRNKQMVMVQYMGEQNGRFQVAIVHNRYYREIYDCMVPCDTVRVRGFSGNRMESKTFMKSNTGSLMDAIFIDAMNGELQRFKTEGNQYVFYDDNNRRVFTDAAPKPAATE